MSESHRGIPPNPPRWKPNPDPSSIHVPGLDSSAPILDQIEQMEQLITIKLQNIDENFSKVQNILANKLLPAVKRYAVGTEPVREAAKFWTSFYEQAAQIRIPAFDDYSSVDDQQSHSGQETETTQSESIPTDSQDHESSMASTESSFMPGQAAFSSTPTVTNRLRAQDSSGSDESADSLSWTASIESPLVRLDRAIQNFSLEDEAETPVPAALPDSSTVSLLKHARSDKGKAREAEPLLRNVLRQNLQSASDLEFTPGVNSISPLKVRGKPKTPIPKNLNPYLPENTRPSEWNGLVNLSNTPLSTPRRRKRDHPSSHRKGDLRSTTPPGDDNDDSFDGLPPGMSPPVLMSPAPPPRSAAELGLIQLGKTPTKEAAKRITRDLINDVQRRSGGEALGRRGYGHQGVSGVESSMSTVPTPPSLSRYTRHGGAFGMDSLDSMAMDSSLESMMRRVGLQVNQSSSSSGSNQPEYAAGPSSFVDSYDPATPGQESDSDSDSLDEVHNTAHPSAAFLMASRARPESDDSFGSSNRSSDSLSGEEVADGLAPVDPFGRGVVQGDGDGFDDTFDDDQYEEAPQEETVFGVPPVQRSRLPSIAPGEPLRMLGEDLLQDTIGIGDQIARTGWAEASPTPAAWAGGSH